MGEDIGVGVLSGVDAGVVLGSEEGFGEAGASGEFGMAKASGALGALDAFGVFCVFGVFDVFGVGFSSGIIPFLEVFIFE